MSNYAFMKVGGHGEAGSGKSFTMTQIAIGLHKAIKSTKPIKIFDTEVASRFLVPIIKKAGVPIDPAKDIIRARSLNALTKLMDACQKGESDILIIDSITHVWENYVETYRQEHGRKRLSFADWGSIKPAWRREYADRLVMGTYNILFTGRSGFTYESTLDENGKVEDIVKSGVKMRVEGDTAYEPDLLLYMERKEEIMGKEKNVWRDVTVLKDRADILDGKTFKNPTFADFKPVWDFLVSGEIPNMPDVDNSSDSELVEKEEDKREEKLQKQIILEEIKATFDQMALGTSGADKKTKADIIERIFMTKSQTAIEAMSLDTLRDAQDRLEKDAQVISLIRKES